MHNHWSTWGYNSRESLIDADADFIADKLDQLLTLLQKEKFWEKMESSQIICSHPNGIEKLN